MKVRDWLADWRTWAILCGVTIAAATVVTSAATVQGQRDTAERLQTLQECMIQALTVPVEDRTPEVLPPDRARLADPRDLVGPPRDRRLRRGRRVDRLPVT